MEQILRSNRSLMLGSVECLYRNWCTISCLCHTVTGPCLEKNIMTLLIPILRHFDSVHGFFSNKVFITEVPFTMQQSWLTRNPSLFGLIVLVQNLKKNKQYKYKHKIVYMKNNTRCALTHIGTVSGPTLKKSTCANYYSQIQTLVHCMIP